MEVERKFVSDNVSPTTFDSFRLRGKQVGDFKLQISINYSVCGKESL